MLDQFGREINYLRISVTDRCNLRCIYCMPEEGIKLIKHEDVLSYEEIFEFVKVAVQFGINKIRFTGGEPLVRKGFVNLVKMISSIKEIKDLSLTTNGLLLSHYAKELKEAGLMRVNVSLDAIDKNEYSRITCGGNVEEVLNGIRIAKEVGLSPIKINCVIQKSTKEKNAIDVKNYCEENELIPRFIQEMDIEKGEFGVVHGGNGGDCENCNRLRLTSDGNLKPCLFNDISINIRKVKYDEAIKFVIENKPACGLSGASHKFYNIGG
ncbi:MAG: radical SAM protein [Melioribacteraceae bacterium]|nr:radical SAM protein [Melioribacteraceae bacterium]